MLEIFGKVFGSILKNLFVSIVMFVIFYSLITREFPPDFSKLASTYENLQELARLGKSSVVKVPKTSLKADEEAVEELEQIYHKRAQLGAQLMPEGRASAPSQEDSFAGEKQRLLTRMQELEAQLFKLQNRVAELEARSQ